MHDSEPEFHHMMSTLYLVAQPIFDTTSDPYSILYYETLLRSSENHRFPCQFFQELIANATNNQLFMAWFQAELSTILKIKNFCVSINLHPQQLLYPETFDMLEKLCPYKDRIMVEVTEDLPNLPHPQKISLFLEDQLTKIHNLGFKIAIDDIDTGIHQLTYVQPLLGLVNCVKLSLLGLKHLSPTELHALIRFWKFKSLDHRLSFVIEGIDNQQIHECLKEHQLYLQQGFFLEKPQSLTKIP